MQLRDDCATFIWKAVSFCVNSNAVNKVRIEFYWFCVVDALQTTCSYCACSILLPFIQTFLISSFLLFYVFTEICTLETSAINLKQCAPWFQFAVELNIIVRNPTLDKKYSCFLLFQSDTPATQSAGLSDRVFPSVLWHCWFGHMTCKIVPKMTYNVLSGTLSLYTTTTTFYLLICVLQEPEMRPSFAELGRNLELITDT